MGFILSEDAKSDLDNIWDYTYDNWGELQADNYMNGLENRFEWLAKNPELGIKRDEIVNGYRSFNEGKHTIYYYEADEDIKIVGIPHQSMDFENQFTQEISQQNSIVDNINEQSYSESDTPNLEAPEQER